MGFNYINKQFSIKKGTLQTGRLQYFNAVHIIKTYYFNVAAEYRAFYLNYCIHFIFVKWFINSGRGQSLHFHFVPSLWTNGGKLGQRPTVKSHRD